MQSSEYEDILSSLQKIVRQAYDLGRADALKQVVEVLRTDPVPPKPLALAAPVPQPSIEPEHKLEPAHATPPQATAAHPVPTHAAPGHADPSSNGADKSGGVLATPAKTPDAPARNEEAPNRPWWAR